MGEPKLPRFFKAIWVTLCSQSLEIPRSYVKHIKVETAQKVYLKGPSGETWAVELVRRDGRLYFEQGWPEFFKFHSLGDMYFLIFKYDGKVNFKVKISDDKLFVKRVAIGPKFGQGLDDPKKSGTMETNAATPPLHASQVAQLPLQDHGRNEVSESGAAKSCAEGHLSFVMSMKSYNVSGSYILPSVPSRFITKHFSSNRDKLEIVLKNKKGKQWPVILLLKKRAISGGWNEFVRANNIEEGDTCTFRFMHGLTVLVHVSPQRNHSEPKRQRIQHVAEVFGDKKERRRVDDKKHHISEGAQNVATAPSHHHTKQTDEEQRVGSSDANDFPSFTVRIKDYNKSFIWVNRNFFSAYCSSYRKNEIIDIENEEGDSCSVTMCRQWKSAILSAGWPLFMQQNKIQEKDMCTFKHVDERKMRVHISRHRAPS